MPQVCYMPDAVEQQMPMYAVTCQVLLDLRMGEWGLHLEDQDLLPLVIAGQWAAACVGLVEHVDFVEVGPLALPDAGIFEKTPELGGSKVLWQELRHSSTLHGQLWVLAGARPYELAAPASCSCCCPAIFFGIRSIALPRHHQRLLCPDSETHR